ncbi:hypothetical protein GC177_01185 [bacterium]|nr:hypothetical protein [bacterium]
MRQASGIFDKFGRAFRLIRQDYARIIGLVMVLFAIPDFLSQIWLYDAWQQNLPPDMLKSGAPVTLDILASYIPAEVLIGAILISILSKLLLLSANALLIASNEQREEASAALLVTASVTLLPRAALLWMRVFLHILAGFLMIVPGIERLFAARFAYYELMLENKPTAESVASADIMANGWRWQLAGAFFIYILIFMIFLQVWAVVTNLLNGQESLLWLMFQGLLTGLIHFTLFSVYVWCWLEARMGLKPVSPFGTPN